MTCTTDTVKIDSTTAVLTVISYYSAHHNTKKKDDIENKFHLCL